MLPPKSPVWHGKAFVALLILLVLASALVRWRLDPVPLVDPGTAATAFSAPAAMDKLTTILGDERPHPVGSKAQTAVRKRIVSILRDLGYTVEVQDTTACNDNWGATCARVQNLVVVSPGTAAGKSLLLMAHYDSVPAGPGASDDGSGVAILLEIARLLKSQPQARNSVILLFTDGEEAGLLGAKAFIERDQRVEDIALAINVESRGTSGQSVMFQTGEASGWLVDAYASSAKRQTTNSLLSAVYNLMPNDTDFTVFRNEGIPGLNFAFGERFPFYHTSRDNLQALDLRTLQQQGDNAYQILSALRDVDLAAASNATAKELVYTDILGLGVVRWPSSWSLGAALALLALLAFAGVMLKRRYRFSGGSIASGVLGFFMVIALGGASAWLLSSALAAMHAPAPAWYTNAFGNRLLLWGGVLLACVWLPSLLIRKSNRLGVLVGVGVACLLTGIATILLLPGLAYLFILPSAVLVVLALAVAVIRSDGWAEYALLALFVLPAIMAFIAIFPAVYIIEVLITFSLPGAIGMGVFLGLAATFLLPLADAENAGRAYLLSSAAVCLVAVIGAVISLSAPAYSDQHPQPLNIRYLQDAEGEGHVFTARPHVALPGALKEAMGADGAYRRLLPWNAGRFYSVPASYPSLPAPDLAVLVDEKTRHGREILIRLDAGSDTQTLTLLVPESAGLSSVQMDGHTLIYSGHTSRMGHYESFVCRGESCDGKQLKLTITGDPEEPFLLVKGTAGVPPEAASIVHARDRSDAVPIGRGDETLIVSTIRL